MIYVIFIDTLISFQIQWYIFNRRIFTVQIKVFVLCWTLKLIPHFNVHTSCIHFKHQLLNLVIKLFKLLLLFLTVLITLFNNKDTHKKLNNLWREKVWILFTYKFYKFFILVVAVYPGLDDKHSFVNESLTYVIIIRLAFQIYSISC